MRFSPLIHVSGSPSRTSVGRGVPHRTVTAQARGVIIISGMKGSGCRLLVGLLLMGCLAPAREEKDTSSINKVGSPSDLVDEVEPNLVARSLPACPLWRSWKPAGARVTSCESDADGLGFHSWEMADRICERRFSRSGQNPGGRAARDLTRFRPDCVNAFDVISDCTPWWKRKVSCQCLTCQR